MGEPATFERDSNGIDNGRGSQYLNASGSMGMVGETSAYSGQAAEQAARRVLPK